MENENVWSYHIKLLCWYLFVLIVLVNIVNCSASFVLLWHLSALAPASHSKWLGFLLLELLLPWTGNLQEWYVFPQYLQIMHIPLLAAFHLSKELFFCSWFFHGYQTLNFILWLSLVLSRPFVPLLFWPMLIPAHWWLLSLFWLLSIPLLSWLPYHHHSCHL